MNVGSRVLTKSGPGTIRFRGQTAFAEGEWLGVELDEPTGKNDGSVNGERYFPVPDGYGVFVRPQVAKPLDGSSNIANSPSPLRSPQRSVSSPRRVVSSPRRDVSRGSQAGAPAVLGSNQPSMPAPGRFDSPPVRSPCAIGLGSPVRVDSRPPSAVGTSPTRSDWGSPVLDSTSSDRATLAKQIDSLRAKLKILDRKRREDKEKVEMSDKLVAINRRLTDKLKALHDEIQTFRNDKTRMDLDLEAATLDKEVAEETLERVREEAENYRRQLETMRQESDKVQEMDAFYKSFDIDDDAGHISALQKRIATLEEALIALRDETLLKDMDAQKAKEKHERELDHITAKLSGVSAKLAEAEDANAHLRSQLDAVKDEGAMFELTTEIDRLSEKCQQLEAAVEELETLKALDEELIENYAAREKQYKVDIQELENAHADMEAQLTEQSTRAGALEENIAKYRQLARSLEHDMELLKAHELQTVASGSKLETSAGTGSFLLRSREMELRLKSFELEQAIEELSIAKCYITNEEHKRDANSIRSLLLLERIGFNSALLADYYSDRNDNPIMTARIRVRLIEIRYRSMRLATAFRFSSQTDFRALSETLGTIEPLHQSLARTVQLLVKGDLSDDNCLDASTATLLGLQRFEEASKVGSRLIFADAAWYLSETCRTLTALFSHVDNDNSANDGHGEVTNVRGILKDITQAAKHLSDVSAHDAENNAREPSMVLMEQTDVQLLESISLDLASLIDFAVDFEEGSSRYLEEHSLSSMSDISSHLEESFNSKLPLLRQITPSQSAEKPVSSWIERANDYQAAWRKQESIKDELRKLHQDNKALSVAVKERDKSIDELNVKVALLSSKQTKSKDQEKALNDLKQQLQATLAKEEALKATIGSLKTSLETQERLVSKLKKNELSGLGEKALLKPGGMSALTIQREIVALSSAVEFLSRQNSRLRDASLSGSDNYLLRYVNVRLSRLVY